MEWNVKNAMNRDVEREHLNKILKEIASRLEQLTVTQAAPTRPTYTPPVVQRPPLTVTLTGDVTGTATGSGSLTIETSLAELVEGLEDAPDDGQIYWRGSETWQVIPLALQAFYATTTEGLLTLTPDGIFENREIVGTEGEIDVENGSGIEFNPTLSLADVPDEGGGVLQKTEFDSKGRKVGTSEATTDDLVEGTENLYFTEERTFDVIADSLVAGDNVQLVVDEEEQTITVGATLPGNILLVDGAPKDGDIVEFNIETGTWIPKRDPRMLYLDGGNF